MFFSVKNVKSPAMSLALRDFLQGNFFCLSPQKEQLITVFFRLMPFLFFKPQKLPPVYAILIKSSCVILLFYV